MYNYSGIPPFGLATITAMLLEKGYRIEQDDLDDLGMKADQRRDFEQAWQEWMAENKYNPRQWSGNLPASRPCEHCEKRGTP